MAWRRVNDHAGRLVDDSQVLVFINHVERYGLGRGLDGVCLWDLELDHVAGDHAVGGIRRPAVHEHQMSLDQTRGGRSAQLGLLLG